ncbi:MAG: ABC transporter permease [Thermaerobacter sp.]|nr:ABC transporter permease [Thermaerobacter sp.]
MKQGSRFWRSAAAVWWRNFLAWRKFWRSSILLNFGEPLTNLLALGLGLGAYVTVMQGVSFLQFIAPGLLAVTSMNAVTFDSGFEGYDRLNSNGVYQSMMTSPLTVPEIVAGEYLWEATRSLLYGAVFFVVVLAFGLVHSAWIALLPIPLLLFGVVFAAPALYVAARAKTHEQLFYYFSLVITPMFMFSGVFFPVQHLPWFVADIIYVLPLYHGVELTRELALGQISLASLWNFLWIVGYAAALMYLPVRALERRLTA